MTIEEIIAHSDDAFPSDIHDKAEQLLMVGGAVALWRLAFISGYQKGVAAEREACAKVADDLAAKRIAFEKSRGFSANTARPVANRYWCEEIAEAIRNRTATDKGE